MLYLCEIFVETYANIVALFICIFCYFMDIQEYNKKNVNISFDVFYKKYTNLKNTKTKIYIVN